MVGKSCGEFGLEVGDACVEERGAVGVGTAGERWTWECRGGGVRRTGGVCSVERCAWWCRGVDGKSSSENVVVGGGEGRIVGIDFVNGNGGGGAK